MGAGRTASAVCAMNRCARVKPDARSIKPWGSDAVRGSGFVEILRLRGMVRLLLPALVARIPDSIAATGIVVLVRSVTGSYTVAGLAAGAFGIGTAVSAPLARRALDRLGQRRALPALPARFAAPPPAPRSGPPPPRTPRPPSPPAPPA